MSLSLVKCDNRTPALYARVRCEFAVKASASFGIRRPFWHSSCLCVHRFYRCSNRQVHDAQSPLDSSDYFSASTLGIQTPLPPRILQHSPLVAFVMPPASLLSSLSLSHKFFLHNYQLWTRSGSFLQHTCSKEPPFASAACARLLRARPSRLTGPRLVASRASRLTSPRLVAPPYLVGRPCLTAPRARLHLATSAARPALYAPRLVNPRASRRHCGAPRASPRCASSQRASPRPPRVSRRALRLVSPSLGASPRLTSSHRNSRSPCQMFGEGKLLLLIALLTLEHLTPRYRLNAPMTLG